ncbi:glycosyltransferase [Microbacterium sp.]|jgi:MGT family glycosyltransferase|uniref:glycosyltransferase n=1 Tax=Microbacterium sp. TaxID=51671 RepID=UPI0037C57A20
MKLLLCSSPIFGHVSPLITVAASLTEAGHDVIFLTGRKYQARVEDAGATFVALPAEADYDDADLEAWLPDRSSRKGLDAVVYDITGMFLRPLAAQHRAVHSLRQAHSFDAIVGESAFLGLLPTLLKEKPGQREPIVGISALPVTQSSVDAAPFGPALAPGKGPVSRLRNRALNTMLAKGPFRPLYAAFGDALAECGAPGEPRVFFDAPTTYDLLLQLSAPELEYPRRELGENVRFLGPLRPAAAKADVALPDWWADLDGKTVVHVTQGTIDNADMTRLIAPTILGLATEDVIVVATTGGTPVDAVHRACGGTIPGNARVAEFIPYSALLPRTDVVVTNGGFGGVQLSIAAGVPLVLAGATEDKPEVAARVAWAGAGVNLKTGTRTPGAVTRGVRAVLKGHYRSRAEEIAAAMAKVGDPLLEIERVLKDAVSTTRPPTPCW